jgi:hypothetical protein
MLKAREMENFKRLLQCRKTFEHTQKKGQKKIKKKIQNFYVCGLFRKLKISLLVDASKLVIILHFFSRFTCTGESFSSINQFS